MAGKNERQRRQARERYRRQQEQRVVRQRRIRKRALVGVTGVALAGLLAALLVVLLPSGSGKKASASASSSPTTSASPSPSVIAEPAHHCTYTKVTGFTPSSRRVSFPPASPNYTASYTATLNTNLGPIRFNLLNDKATCTVNSFVHLAEAGFFNKTQCHRLLTSGIFVLQCGDPYSTSTTKLTCSTTSTVGTGSPGYAYLSENLTGATYPAGTVAMANSNTANSNGSQFFIVYKDSTSGLTPSYTPFATVSSGLNIVQNVGKAGYSCQYAQAGGGAPKEKVIIESVTIKQS